MARRARIRGLQGLGCGLIAIMGGALAPTVGAAHLGHVVTSAERYLKVDAAEGQIRVVISLSLAGSEHTRVLRAADLNRDSRVSQEEADAYMAQWAEGLRTDLPIELDGRPAVAEWGQAFLGPAGAIEGRQGTVEIVARFDVDAGSHRLTLHDRMRRETFDRTDVVFRAREGARVVASGSGARAPSTVVESPHFVRGDGPEHFTAVVEVPRAPPPAEQERAPQPLWPYLGGLGVAGIGAWLAWLLRRRR